MSYHPCLILHANLRSWCLIVLNEIMNGQKVTLLGVIKREARLAGGRFAWK